MSPRAFLILVLLLALAVPASAAAAGTSELDLRGAAAQSLRGQGVKLAAKRPARLLRGTLRLPVAGGVVARAAYLTHRGALVLSRRAQGRRRVLVVRRLQVRLGEKSSVIASVGRERLTLMRVALARRDLSLDAANGTARLTGARLALTRGARTLLKRRLMLRRLPPRGLGRLVVDALVGPGGGGPGGGGGGGGGPGGPPQSGPITDEPTPLARPAGAVDVTGAQLTWHVRPSWIRYVSAGEGATAFGGAAPEPATTTPQCGEASEPAVSLVYAFGFPFARGWYHRPSGTAAVHFGGGVNFSYADHGIDLDASEPEIELNGAASRAVFRFAGSGSTALGGKRGVLVNLDPAAAPPTTTATSVAYERIPGTIPAGGSQSVFAGFYAPGTRFGCMSVSFAHPPIP